MVKCSHTDDTKKKNSNTDNHEDELLYIEYTAEVHKHQSSDETEPRMRKTEGCIQRGNQLKVKTGVQMN